MATPMGLTPDRISELKQNEEIIQILYIAEQYLGKTLTPTESQKLLFFYDGLGLSADLIEYLLEYCVSHNHKSIRYIEKVAIAWAENGVTTVEQAKQSCSRYSRETMGYVVRYQILAGEHSRQDALKLLQRSAHK